MSYDHIIIGAGVIGASTAYHLKRQRPEAKVLLLDKGSRPGTGNTAKSAALYRNIFSSETSRQLASSSIRYYQELGQKIKLDPVGYLWLFSEDQWKGSREARESLDPDTDELDFLEAEDITRLLKIETAASGRLPDVYAGIHGRLCGSLSAMSLASHYAEEFKKLGGEIKYNTEVVSFTLAGAKSRYAPWDEVQVTAAVDREGRKYQAPHFTAAVGAWTHQLLTPLGVAPSVLPKKRQLFGLKLKDFSRLTGRNHDASGKLPAIILPAGGVYMKPVPERRMLILGCADELGQPYQMKDPGPDPDYFELAIEPVLNHYFPRVTDYELALKWAGYYAYHWPDKNPVLETVANLTWVSGTSGSGIMKADAIGRVAAGRLLDEKRVELADGTSFLVNRLSLRERAVENEKFII